MRTLPLRAEALGAALLCVLLLGRVAPASAQEMGAGRPFAPGEELSYQVSVGQTGMTGIGWLRVEPAEPLRGEPVVLLRFDFSAQLGPLRVHHRSRSWLSTQRFASLRAEVDEQVPFHTVRERVELYPDERRWEGLRAQGQSSSAEPLDELSCLYALRMLELVPGTGFRADWHFDPRRNPVQVRVLRRERLRVPAGEFSTVVVEMEVRDPSRFGGRGLLRLYVTEDARRLPVRIESQVPMAGLLVLELRTPREES